MSQRRLRVLIGIFRASLAGIVAAIAGCAPLPGNSLDPVFMSGIFGSGKTSEQAALPEKKGTPPAETITTGQTAWAGRYQDSRGSGDITMSLVRGATTISGVWSLRTGGGGPVTMVAETEQRFQLRMENIARECPGIFEGSVEISDTAINGNYKGKDCAGAVKDGRLELRPK